MDFEEKLEFAKDLIAKREIIDRQLAELFGGAAPAPRLSRTCSKCGESGHTARTCTTTEKSADTLRLV